MFQIGQTTIGRRWKNDQSINWLKVEGEEDGAGDHPWVEAALRAGKVFSAVTHSSSAFHNNQQEKIYLLQAFHLSWEQHLFVIKCHWRGICSQYAVVPTLLEKSARNSNAKFCQIENRRRGAYRARRQLMCAEWHFLKEDKKWRSLTGKLPLPSN